MRGRGARCWLAWTALLVACGGPFDRKDGALRIELRAVPDEADRASVVVHASGRDFPWQGALPPSRVIDALDAVPVGSATVDVVVYATEVEVGRKTGMPVEIREGETTALTASFSELPEVEIEDPPENAAHFLAEGPSIFLRVVPLDPTLAIDLRVTANGQPVAVAASALDWSGTVDAALAGAVLPAAITLEVEACRSGQRICVRVERAVVVHRHEWAAALGTIPRARPVVGGGVVVLGDDEGRLHVLDEAGGAPRFPALELAAPLSARVGLSAEQAVVVDGAGSLARVRLSDGVQLAVIELGAGRASAVVYDGTRFVTTDDDRVLALDGMQGGLQTLAQLPAAIRAEPLADAMGVVVADTQGHVVGLDGAGATVFSAQVGAAVLAQPVRDGAGAVVADTSGALSAISVSGEVTVLARLGGPLAHPPVKVGADWVITVGDRLARVGPSGVRFLSLGEPATGGAELLQGYGAGAVALGLRSGLVVVVGEGGDKRVLSRVEGAALHGVALDRRRLLVSGSRGDLQMLRPEEAF